MSVVFYAHGVGGTAWHGARDSAWLDVAAKENLIVVFIQSKGLFYSEQRKNSAGKDVWAASSWDYIYSANDLQYLDAVYDVVVKQLFVGVVDCGRVFFCGFDSGGLFAWSVACAYGGSKFSAIFMHNGGIDEHYLCDRRTMSHPISSGKPVPYDQKRCPVWVSCAETYEHKQRSVAAKRVFDELAWPVKFTQLRAPGDPADWPLGLEQEAWAWFLTARDDALIEHVGGM